MRSVCLGVAFISILIKGAKLKGQNYFMKIDIMYKLTLQSKMVISLFWKPKYFLRLEKSHNSLWKFIRGKIFHQFWWKKLIKLKKSNCENKKLIYNHMLSNFGCIKVLKIVYKLNFTKFFEILSTLQNSSSQILRFTWYKDTKSCAVALSKFFLCTSVQKCWEPLLWKMFWLFFLSTKFTFKVHNCSAWL